MEEPKRTAEGKFEKGHSGNPDGRPPGSRNKMTLAVEALLADGATQVTRQVLDHAWCGNPTALRLCLDRIAPSRKGRPLQFALPKLETPADLAATAAAIMEAVGDGELTPPEAADLFKLLEAFSRFQKASDRREQAATAERGQANGKEAACPA